MCVVDVGEDPTSVEFNRVNLPPGGLRRKNSMTPQMASSPNMPPATLPAITPMLEEDDGDEVEVEVEEVEVVDPEEFDCPDRVELAVVDV